MFVIWNQEAKGYYTGESCRTEGLWRSFEFVDRPEDAKQFETRDLAASWMARRLTKEALEKKTSGIEIKEITASGRLT